MTLLQVTSENVQCVAPSASHERLTKLILCRLWSALTATMILISATLTKRVARCPPAFLMPSTLPDNHWNYRASPHPLERAGVSQSARRFSLVGDRRFGQRGICDSLF